MIVIFCQDHIYIAHNKSIIKLKNGGFYTLPRITSHIPYMGYMIPKCVKEHIIHIRNSRSNAEPESLNKEHNTLIKDYNSKKEMHVFEQFDIILKICIL